MRAPTAPLVLASASPRRAELLQRAGVHFVQRPGVCDEREHPGEDPVAYARRIAAAKAVAGAHGDALVLAADTVVWRSAAQGPIGKPRDRAHAAELLRGLAGATHHVTTAWALAGCVPCEVHHETTRVWMRPLGDDEIDDYLDGDEWRDKAGGYGIQGLAAAFVTRIEGSYTNVVGLPLAEVVLRLRVLAGAQP